MHVIYVYFVGMIQYTCSFYLLNLAFFCMAEVRRSFITTTVREESQVTPQGRYW